MMNHHQPQDELSLIALLEALLFVAPGAVTIAQLASALDRPLQEVEEALAELETCYQDESHQRGLRLQRHRGRVQLTTAPQAAPVIERLLGLEATSRLSRAALETLAIIAYQQPVTRPQIDAIRGVNSDGVLKNLLSKGLIQEVGRAEAAGRPILYSTTAEFLQHFGLNSLSDLPPLEEQPEVPTPNHTPPEMEA
jgi:segregation and condensation protein B